jgi:hypothetical protein
MTFSEERGRRRKKEFVAHRLATRAARQVRRGLPPRFKRDKPQAKKAPL